VVKPPRNVDHFFVMETRDLLGKFLVICITVPELAMIAPAESVDLTILTESNRVVAPASYFYYAYALADVLNDLCWPSIWIGKRDGRRVI